MAKNRSRLYQEKQELKDELGSSDKYAAKSDGRPDRKKSLYQKCLDEIDSDEYGFTDEVKEKLRDYLPFVTDNSSEKRIKGLNMWKGKLKQLIALSKEPTVQVRIVKQSINEGWFKFAKLGHGKNGPTQDGLRRPKFVNREDAIAELERRMENVRQGKSKCYY